MMHVLLDWFTQDTNFPFFIQFGTHSEETLIQNHCHDDFSELVIVLGGTAMHVVEGEEYLLRKGDVFVINEDTAHYFKQPHHFKICNIMYRHADLLANDVDIKKTAGFHALFMIEPSLAKGHHFQSHMRLSYEEFESVEKQLEEMLSEYNHKQVGYITSLKADFMRLIVFLSRRYESGQSEKGNKVLRIAIPLSHMENHFAEITGIQELADMASMSARHFSRIFQNAYHLSPMTYIIHLRMAYAKTLLASTQKNVTEISYDCGYQDSNYFTRQFKKYYNITPLKCRKLLSQSGTQAY